MPHMAYVTVVMQTQQYWNFISGLSSETAVMELNETEVHIYLN